MYETYKNFIIENNSTYHGGEQWTIYSPEGHWLTNFTSKKACFDYVDELTKTGEINE